MLQVQVLTQDAGQASQASSSHVPVVGSHAGGRPAKPTDEQRQQASPALQAVAICIGPSC